MSTISCIFSSLPWVPSSKLSTREPINKNITYLHNFGGIFTSKAPRLMQAKFDHAQDLSNINNFDKIVDHQVAKRVYAQDSHVVQQNFFVRFYDLDIHKKASLETLLNYTKETSVNLFQSTGLLVEGYGVSKEMSNKNLIWVMGRLQAVVNSYPSWGDIIQVETWCSDLTKHSITCSSRLTNATTGEKFLRVDSDFFMINENTRRLSKFPEEITERGKPYVKQDLDPLPLTIKYGKLRKCDEEKADCIQREIKPLWFDLDANQHVNHVRYVSWIVEGTPEPIRKKHELEAMTVEYRRECRRENLLTSLSAASIENPQEFDHSLRLETGTEVARARTLWRPRDYC